MSVPIRTLAEDQSLPICRFIDLIDIHTGNQGTVSSLLKHDLLSSSRGLHLLAAAVPLMREEELTEKGTALIALCLKVCKNKNVYSETDAAIAYDILGKLLDRCRDLPNVEVIVTTQAIMELVQQCLPQTSCIEKVPSLICLHALVNRYIKQVIAHRANIEKYLIQFLDSDDLSSVMVAAKITNLLQQIRLPGESGPPRAAWREQLERLCKAAQDIIDRLYSGATDFYKNNYFEDVPSDTTSTVRGHLTMALENLCQITPCDSKELTAVACVVTYATRLHNVMVFIQAMLVESFPGVKAVRPHPVLECVIRLLGVSVAYQATSADAATLAVLHAGLRLRALKTLDALIHCLGTNLVPYSALIFRLAFQNLRWSEDHRGNSGKSVRAKAYSTISLWMMTLKSHQFVRNTGDGLDQEQQLVNFIKDDISEKKATFELMITPSSRKNMSKRAMRKLVNSQLGRSTLASHAPGANKADERRNRSENTVTLEALNCLRVLLHTAGIFLNTSTYNQISGLVLPLCLELHRSEVRSRSDSAYRASLYRCVEALQTGCKSSAVAPTQYCLHLYALGQHDRDTKVAAFCSRALFWLRSSLHGVPPTLNFGLQSVLAHNEVSGVSKHAVSERNLAALNSLLGEERVPTIDVDDNDDPPLQNLHNGLEPSTYSNDMEGILTSGQKRKQPEECQERVVKTRRSSVVDPINVDIPPAISIASSDEEDILLDSHKDNEQNDSEKESSQASVDTLVEETDETLLEDDDEVVCLVDDVVVPPQENYQKIDTTRREQIGSGNDTQRDVQTPPEPSIDNNETSVAALVSNQSSEQEVVDADDDESVKVLPSHGDTNSSGDVNISCAQAAKSEQVSQEMIQNDGAHGQAEGGNVGHTENVNGNLSVDEMMADFVDTVVA